MVTVTIQDNATDLIVNWRALVEDSLSGDEPINLGDTDFIQVFDDIDLDTATVVTLTSSLIVLTVPHSTLGVPVTVTMSGTGIGPVSSLAGLVSAIENGVATGAINLITVTNPSSGKRWARLRFRLAAIRSRRGMRFMR